MPLLELSVTSKEPDLSVRRFSIHEGISQLFAVSILFRSPNQFIDLEGIVGKPASFRVISGYRHTRLGGERLWTGLCNHVEQVQVEPTGLATYSLSIVPVLWMLTQKRDHRIFQHLSIPDIVDKVLEKWRIPPVWKVDRGSYPKLEYKVQYGETDYAFMCRLLEEAGIAFTFPDNDQEGSKLTLDDKLQAGEARTPPIPYLDNPTQAAEREFVTHVRLSQEVRPGAHTIRDYDFRNPAFQLFGEATRAKAPEDRYEQYSYQPGSFLVETGRGGDTPVADDKGVARYDEKAGATRAEKALKARRFDTRAVSFEANTIDLWPGVVFSVQGHPHSALAQKLLVTEFSIEGTHDQDWTMAGRASFAAVSYVPPQRTQKPVITSVQSATVVGPDGQEIHTDEFGRVRVQFPWDRDGKTDENSSCWIRVSQGWAGAGYGMIMIPRMGQEVLVGFLDGDPDQPIVVGRVFNARQPPVYKLPEDKTQSGWKTDSTTGSSGANEIMFEDSKGNELAFWTAHKNMRKLVKNDETITVGRNREKGVAVNETDTTVLNRTEVTVANRTETANASKVTFIAGERRKLIRGDEHHTTDGHRRLLAMKDVDIVTKQVKRERVVEDIDLVVKGDRREKIHQSQSLVVHEDQWEKVGRNHALQTGRELNLRSGHTLVGEAAKDVTIKGPGGFIRLDASGVTIKGKVVKINAGGSPRKGRGAKPEEPEKAKQREPDEDKKHG